MSTLPEKLLTSNLALQGSSPLAGAAAAPTVSSLTAASLQTTILWRNRASGVNAVWLLNGTEYLANRSLPTVTNSNWTIVATGDFNADTQTDLVWYNTATDQPAIWLMNGTQLQAAPLLPKASNSNWRIVGTGDFNADTQTDLVWFNAATGSTAVWFLNGTGVASTTALPYSVNLNWKLVSTGDFNADEQIDWLWFNRATGQTAVWFLNGTSLQSAAVLRLTAGANWQIQGVEDFNADTHLDILWRNQATGHNAVWLLNGDRVIGAPSLPTVSDLNWQAIAPFPLSNAGTIGGSVWNDINGNGSRDPDEPGLAGWTLYLDQNQNNQLDASEISVSTNAAGAYTFAGLSAGTYHVTQALPSGWQGTFPTSGLSPAVTIAANQGIASINFGDRAILSSLTLTPFASGFSQPTGITHSTDPSDNHLYVVEQPGQIRTVQNGTVSSTPFLDIRDRVLFNGEQGLLSVAFAPNYATTRDFYVYYTSRNGDNVVSRFRVPIGSSNADPSSEQIVLTIPHPTYSNHNGGQLAFGADGYLYIGTGDGGGAGDPNNNAQNPDSLLGKLLRIDVEAPGTATYTVPASNPFVGAKDPTHAYRDEIWALGLRNPWRFSFDRQTNDLYIGDVGQGAYEEIDYQPATSTGGENYGWRILEGSHRYNNSTQDLTGLTLPIVEYDHSQGRSVTGGYVYRGLASPRLQGVYLYADFETGGIWGLRRSTTGWETQRLQSPAYSVSAFGDDQQGNLYLADYGSGTIYQISG